MHKRETAADVSRNNGNRYQQNNMPMCMKTVSPSSKIVRRGAPQISIIYTCINATKELQG